MVGLALLASAAISCGDFAAWTDNAPSPTGDETESASLALATEPLASPGANGLGLDFTPPGGLYMTSFSATFQYQGEYAHTAYFYQPNTAQAVVRFTLRSESAGTSTRDPATVFSSMLLVSNPDQPNPTEEGLTAISDGIHFDGVTRGQGWYALKFVYRPTGSNRVLTYEAVDAQGIPMKTAWVAPSGKTCKLRASFKVSSAQNVYFKGAAFSGASLHQFAYLDNIKVNGKLLYRKSFDQGLFNHPVGFLPTLTHSLEFDFAAWSGAPSRSWFGVSAVSFDPNQVKTRWDAVQFLYQGPMHTADYDAWNEGVAFAQSSGSVGSGSASFPKLGVRPPPVRRGTTFGIAIEHSSLVGTSSNAIIEIAQADTGASVAWQRSLTSGFDYLGGVYSPVGFSPIQREHWNVTIPMDAAIGRYVLKAFTPSRTQIGSDVLFYVIHNPYAYVGTAGLSKAEVEGYGYDEDEDGQGWNLASTQADTDQDHGRDNFVVVVDPVGVDANGRYVPSESYSGEVVHTGAFRRSSERGTWDHSMLDYAMASAQGTTSEFETMIRLMRFVNQRAVYANTRMSQDAEGGLGGWVQEDPARTLAIANACSQPGTVPPECVHGEAVCYTFASRLAAIARSAGLLSRALNSDTHAVTEAYLPNPPNGTSFPNGDRWFVFDSTDHMSNPEGPYVDRYDLSDQPSAFFNNYWEALGQRGQHCLGQKLTLAMDSGRTAPCNWITTSLDWEVPEGPGGAALGNNGGKILTADYETDAGYWIPSTGVTGWLAFGDKVVYRINKASVNANYIRVRALPSKAGTNLVPELCILAPPLEVSAAKLKQRCLDAANVRKIPDGDSYVVVFNDSKNLQRFHGDVTQYRIEVGSGAGWERCDDGIRNGQEVAVDCGGNCPGCKIGQPCTMAPDCQSLVCNYRTNKCVAACTVDTAVDMGVPGQQTIVPSDGCVKVHAGYPSWWQSRMMNLLNGGGGRYPIPFVFSNMCPDGGFTSGGTITADWETHLVGPITSPCPTVFDLRGDGTSNVILYYYGL
jgi:hypothetical protein